MLITTRLTLAWSLAGLLVFGGYGAWVVQQEREDLARSVEREMWLLGTSVQVAVENALRDGQLDDVGETATNIERIDASVDVAVFGRDREVLLTTGPGAAGVQPTGAPPARAALRYLPPDDPDRLVLVAPLREPGRELFGTLVVARPLADVKRDLAATTGTVALTVGLFVVTSAGLGWALGRAYIGGPLGSLVQVMRTVRGGNLRPVLERGRSDEIGAVAAEFDAMMAELAQARERLQEAAESRRQLERALQQADKLATLGQLAATVAHEIGSPLQVLHGRGQALLRAPDDPARVTRHAGILVRETERIARIVEQLLAITRPRTAGRGRVDLAVLVERTLELFELEARRRGVALSGLLPGAVHVHGLGDRLQQVVVNLVGNALAATGSGGRIVVELSERPDGASIVVRDTGSGMTPEVAERVFEPFFTTRADAGGTGLGLAVVKSIVDEHGGRISVETQAGSGTSFRVLLPTGTEELE